MTARERLQAALQQLVNVDQETLSVSVSDTGDTEDECYNNARVWLERALACRATNMAAAGFDEEDEPEDHRDRALDSQGYSY